MAVDDLSSLDDLRHYVSQISIQLQKIFPPDEVAATFVGVGVRSFAVRYPLEDVKSFLLTVAADYEKPEVAN